MRPLEGNTGAFAGPGAARLVLGPQAAGAQRPQRSRPVAAPAAAGLLPVAIRQGDPPRSELGPPSQPLRRWQAASGGLPLPHPLASPLTAAGGGA